MYQPIGFAETIFNQRYAITETETFAEACKRVASHVAMAENGNREKWVERFNDLLVKNKFVPAGRIGMVVEG